MKHDDEASSSMESVTVTTQYSMLFFNDMYRSFPPVRMTALRFVVILTEGKNLYIPISGNTIFVHETFGFRKQLPHKQ